MKRLLRTLVLLLSLVLLAGCATVQLNVRVKPDGTGEKEMILAIDKEVLGLMSSGGKDPLEEMQADLKKDPNTVITRYEEGSRVGFKAVAPFSGSLDMQDKAWSGAFTNQDSLFWRDYKLDLDADLNMDNMKDDQMASAFLSKIDFRVSFDLPTKVATHNGQVDGTGKKVSWTLVPGRKDHLTLQARQYHTGRIAGAGIGAVGILGAGGFLLLRKKKGPAADSIDA